MIRADGGDGDDGEDDNNDDFSGNSTMVVTMVVVVATNVWKEGGGNTTEHVTSLEQYSRHIQLIYLYIINPQNKFIKFPPDLPIHGSGINV